MRKRDRETEISARSVGVRSKELSTEDTSTLRPINNCQLQPLIASVNHNIAPLCLRTAPILALPVFGQVFA